MSSHALLLFVPPEAHDELVLTLTTLNGRVRGPARRAISINTINGESADDSVYATALREAGFERDHRGLRASVAFSTSPK